MHGAGGQVVGVAAMAALLLGPVVIALLAAVWPRRPAGAAAAAPAGGGAWLRMLLNSTLMYVIAFNVVFFLQELFLVLPKALYPGLRPTLYHNNHSWEGDAEIAQLFQGCGALAIVIAGTAAFVALRRGGRSQWRLLLFWLAQQGFVQGLPQAPSGVIDPTTDVGDAMTYLALPLNVQIAASAVALALLVAALLGLSRRLQEFVPPLAADTRMGRMRAALLLACAPALLAVPLIALYRAPQESVGALLAPQFMYALIGTPWLAASAWLFRVTPAEPNDIARRVDWKPFALAAALLAFFQLALAPGVTF